MADRYIPYKYSAEMQWNGDEVIDIPSTNISNMIIDYNYDNRKMPIIFLSCNISKTLLDRMIKNRLGSTIILTIKKFTVNKDGIPSTKINYIKDEFVYFMQDDVNYNKDVESDMTENVERDDLYSRVLIGLLKMDSINNNKKNINYIYRKTSKTDIILHNTSHMKLLLEPLDNEKIFPELIVPPITSVSELLDFIDSKSSLYKTPYRYFMDFDRTYLLSSSGKNTQAIDEQVRNVIINIDNPVTKYGKIQGVYVEKDTHIIEIDGIYTRYFFDNKTDNMYNNIITVDGTGNVSSYDIDLFKIKGSAPKSTILRSDNPGRADMVKKKLELGKVTFKIIKNDIDCSVFTPNKEFNINNFKDHKEYNGKYILSERKEIFVKELEDFKSNIILLFKKVI